MIRTAIIEDDPRIAADIAEVIRQADDVELVASAGSVATGCKLIDEGGFDVLVCALGLPDGDGTTLIRKAAACQRTGTTFCSIAPKTDCPSLPFISIFTVSP